MSRLWAVGSRTVILYRSGNHTPFLLPFKEIAEWTPMMRYHLVSHPGDRMEMAHDPPPTSITSTNREMPESKRLPRHWHTIYNPHLPTVLEPTLCQSSQSSKPSYHAASNSHLLTPTSRQQAQFTICIITVDRYRAFGCVYRVGILIMCQDARLGISQHAATEFNRYVTLTCPVHAVGMGT